MSDQPEPRTFSWKEYGRLVVNRLDRLDDLMTELQRTQEQHGREKPDWAAIQELREEMKTKASAAALRSLREDLTKSDKETAVALAKLAVKVGLVAALLSGGTFALMALAQWLLTK